jgi:GNAT superfamily N-acetyltransferase
VDIRQCREADLELLEAHMPSPGQTRRHAMRFDHQEQGLSTFLVAWSGEIPIGSGRILWRGCAAPEVSQRFPNCPELNGLGVWPPERRSQGVGSAIIRVAEDHVRSRVYRQLGLGVDDSNHRAAALYLRLGYHETGCHYLDRYHYIDDHGTRHEVADPARLLIKPLLAVPA